MSNIKRNKKYSSKLSTHSFFSLAQRLINEFADVRAIKNMLLGSGNKKYKKKQNNYKQNNKGNKNMKNLKHLKLFMLSSILLAVIVTGVALKNQEVTNVNKQALLEIPVKESLRGTSEFFYKPEGDSRTWHIINKYSSGLSENSKMHNNSEYTFTNECVTVENNYVGINNYELIANK